MIKKRSQLSLKCLHTQAHEALILSAHENGRADGHLERKTTDSGFPKAPRTFSRSTWSGRLALYIDQVAISGQHQPDRQPTTL